MKVHSFTRAQIILSLLTVGWIAFIFSNSLQVAEVSSKESGMVLKLIQGVLQYFGSPVSLSDHIIRKSGHFCEYTGLGIWLGITLHTYTKRILPHISLPLFIGLAVPVTDEFIQLFVPGRGSMVQDVVLDFAGVLTGLTVTLCSIWMNAKHRLSHTEKGKSK